MILLLGDVNLLPALTAAQTIKLKHLSIISLAAKCQVSVQVASSLSNHGELEVAIYQCHDSCPCLSSTVPYN